MKKTAIILLVSFCISNTLMSINRVSAQDIGVSYTMGNVTWTGVTYKGLFYLESSEGESCTYNYNIGQLPSGLYSLNIYNPRIVGWYPASFVLYPNGTIHAIINNYRYPGYWKDLQDQQSQSVSFGDSYCSKYRGKKCSVQGPYDAVPCNCSGFSCSNRDASICSKCKHHATKHNR